MNTNSLLPTTQYKTLILSGGSFGGIATIGAIYELYNLNQHKDLSMFIGTSIGSIIAYLLIIGYTPLDLLQIVCHSDLLSGLKDIKLGNFIKGKGLANFGTIASQLEELTIKKIGRYLLMKDIFQVFHKELVIITYNLTENKTEYITSDTHPDLPVIIALRMSCNIPILFDRFYYNFCEYVDGGTSNNFAIDYSGIKYPAVGIYLDWEPEMIDTSELSITNYIYKIFAIPMKECNEMRIKSNKDCVINKIIIPKEFNIVSTPDLSLDQKMTLFSLGMKQFKY